MFLAFPFSFLVTVLPRLFVDSSFSFGSYCWLVLGSRARRVVFTSLSLSHLRQNFLNLPFTFFRGIFPLYFLISYAVSLLRRLLCGRSSFLDEFHCRISCTVNSLVSQVSGFHRLMTPGIAPWDSDPAWNGEKDSPSARETR